MTSQEADDIDAALLRKYREAGDAQALEPTEAVRSAILAEGRRIAQQRAAAPPLRNFDASQPAANQPRWRIAAFGTFGVAILAALLVVPRWLTPTALSPQVARTASAPAPAAHTNTPSAPAAESLPAKPESQRAVEARQVAPGIPAKRATDSFSDQRKQSSSEQNFDAQLAEGAPPAPTGGANTADSAAAPRGHSVVGSAARTARATASAAPPAALSPAIPLLAAVTVGDLSQVGILLGQHAATEDRDDLGRTPLMIATVQGQLEIVRLLLAHGADPNAPDKTGSTPLQQARRSQFVEIAQTLERAGAH